MSTEQEQAVETVEATENKGASPEMMHIFVNGRKLQVTKSALFAEKSWPDFGPGDTVSVHYRIKEGDKERIQVYEGTVISIRGESYNRTFTVRRIAHDVGVERTFPYHSPWIAHIDVKRKGRVRRAKLFFLRGLSGKAGRIKEAFKK
jgi:large subunit ribosomal protein L19